MWKIQGLFAIARSELSKVNDESIVKMHKLTL
jgi:hypothetical protein